jgi:hypothetical protein
MGARFAPAAWAIALLLAAAQEFGVLQGTVVDQNGMPIPGAAIRLERPGGPPIEPARTDGQGVFRLTGLVPGAAYTLHAATCRTPGNRHPISACPSECDSIGNRPRPADTRSSIPRSSGGRSAGSWG